MDKREILEALRDVMVDNGGELPEFSGPPFIKCNHGPTYNQYGIEGGIGEGIWVRPFSGDDCEGIGFLANTSLNYGEWGDIVHYTTDNPEHNPIIRLVVQLPFNLNEEVRRYFALTNKEETK